MQLDDKHDNYLDKRRGSVTYTHDNRGNLTGSSSGNVYNFDYADRLTQVTIGGQTIQYTYDGFGNRTSRLSGGIETRYVLDLNGSMSNILAETDSGNNITNYYVYGHGLISKITSAGQRYIYHYDNIGNTIAITDSTENVTESYMYDEFGKALSVNETTYNPFRYVGKYGVMDEGNGLLFMRARFYDVDNGRFIKKDPIGFAGGDLNLYAYVRGNPIIMIDPKGEFPTWDDVKRAAKEKVASAKEKITETAKKVGEFVKDNTTVILKSLSEASIITGKSDTTLGQTFKYSSRISSGIDMGSGVNDAVQEYKMGLTNREIRQLCLNGEIPDSDLCYTPEIINPNVSMYNFGLPAVKEGINLSYP